MNKQGKGKIEWTDWTLSIVTGCLYGCDYGPQGCFANRIAQRIYAEKFEPTFRPERIAPAERKLKKLSDGQKIFLTDMGELFGPWVPAEWIQANIDLAKRHPDHTFQFLTKNPSRYLEFDFPLNCWLGTTIDREEKYAERSAPFWKMNGNHVHFVSFEPLLTSMPLDSAFDWAIIGELTGKAMTQEEIHQVKLWAEDIIEQAKDMNIPVFVKNALGTIFPQREWPR